MSSNSWRNSYPLVSFVFKMRYWKCETFWLVVSLSNHSDWRHHHFFRTSFPTITQTPHTTKKTHIFCQFCFKIYFCKKYLQILLWKFFCRKLLPIFLQNILYKTIFATNFVGNTYEFYNFIGNNYPRRNYLPIKILRENSRKKIFSCKSC